MTGQETIPRLLIAADFGLLQEVCLSVNGEEKAETLRFEAIVRGFSVALQDPVKFDDRARQIRGAGRVNSRVAVRIEGKQSGEQFHAEGYTKDISTKGCLVAVPQEFRVGDRVQVINLVNQNSCEGSVIWRGHEGPGGWELGIALHNAKPDFWGLDF